MLCKLCIVIMFFADIPIISGIHIEVFYMLSNIYKFDLSIMRDRRVTTWPHLIYRKEYLLVSVTIHNYEMFSIHIWMISVIIFEKIKASWSSIIAIMNHLKKGNSLLRNLILFPSLLAPGSQLMAPFLTLLHIGKVKVCKLFRIIYILWVRSKLFDRFVKKHLQDWCNKFDTLYIWTSGSYKHHAGQNELLLEGDSSYKDFDIFHD